MTAIGDSTPVRVCTKCATEKPATLEFFRKQARGLYGLRSQCRVCEAEYNRVQKKAHYAANAEAERSKRAEHRANNPERAKEVRSAFYARHSERLRQKRVEYYAANRERISEQRRAQYAENLEASREEQRARRRNDPERVRERERKYRQENLERIRAQERVTGLRKFYRRYRSDIAYTLKVRTSALVRASLRSGSKSRKTQELLGYTVEQLRSHLESLFTDGMNWDRFMSGEIHIDHIRPVSSFDITSDDCEEFRACWALGNLQPLWAFDNLSKGATFPAAHDAT